MHAAAPSRTAYRVALRRAAHQVFDAPVVFPDPLALRILGLDDGSMRDAVLRAPKRPSSRSLRAFLVARSRFAEDALAQAAAKGFTQYVLLGAGLDTFAYRNPWPHVQVFEVDHPATQAWKQDLLREHGIAVPSTCRHVPVDFEREELVSQLATAGFRPDARTVFACLGVVPYLTMEAMRSALRALGSLPAPKRLVLDYALPRHLLTPREQLELDSLSARVAQAGEPFYQFFTPEEIAAELKDVGLEVVEDINSNGINSRYFTDADAGLRVLGGGGHLLLAREARAGQQSKF